MVKDAEANAEEDKKMRELIDARNQCDHMVHSVKKSLKDQGDKVGEDEKSKIEAALKDAEEAMKSDDKAKIEAATKALAESAHKLAEQMYAQEQAKQQQGAAQPGAGASAGTGQSPGGQQSQDDGNVVDAEYEEVKDKK
jgi:molecular chaperone DnaK